MTTRRTRKPKKPPTTRKTSLYRLTDDGTGNLRALVRPRYLDREGFQAHEVENGPVQGLLVTGTVSPGSADWCATLADLTGLAVAEENRTSFGLLLVRTEKHVYALSHGMGHLMIEPARIDSGFGIHFAVRCLDKDGVTRVRRQVMDARGRSDENSVASGEHIRGFGIEEFGEIVSQIAGKISGVPLTFTSDGERSAHITGNDRSVKLRLGRTPEGLMHDLHAIEEVCDRSDPLPEFEFITHVLPLRGKSDLAQHLDERLDEMLGTGDLGRVALAVPSECREGFDAAETFRVKLTGRTRNLSELDADVLTLPVRERPVGERLSTLRKGKVQMFADTEAKETLSGEVPAARWLTAEVTEDNVHYFLWQGQWYEVGAEYLKTVKRRVTELLERSSGVTLPPWPKDRSEGEYNKEDAAAREGYVHLDKQNVHTARLNGGGWEVCDVLGPEGQLIHVKKAPTGTAPLNHLFAQARMCVETLRYDAEARQRFAEKLDALAPDHPADRGFKKPTVVLGILLKEGERVTADSLFSFAQISLLHTDNMLKGLEARLEVVSISR
ncbi:DUF6119 family protein [Nocardiopsis halotolerans]|uniref:DUF6119 family protein n=1 Tax=Nocardiopsis halotolerans TaxID=124252 RepID=UPI00034C4754|nr:DUF6119 family protein [Nocardiopsis halotolerans]